MNGRYINIMNDKIYSEKIPEDWRSSTTYKASLPYLKCNSDV